MKELVIIRGASGSGKTTLAKTMFSTYEHCEADNYFELLAKNMSEEHKTKLFYQDMFDKKELPNAHAYCKSEARKHLFNDKNVVVSNTFTKHWEMLPYLDMANEFGYSVKIYELKKNYGNTHGVPQETIKNMQNNFEPWTEDRYKDVPVSVVVVS